MMLASNPLVRHGDFTAPGAVVMAVVVIILAYLILRLMLK
jgi:hypothetical protein